MRVLSKAQKTIYHMEKYVGGSVANICGSLLCKGKADFSALKKAINELYRRNEILRTRISETEQGVMQETVEDYERQIPVLKFSSEDEFAIYAEKYAKQEMDLYGELCYINLVDMGQKFGVLVKIHHIIGDAWTVSLLCSQFIDEINGKVWEAYPYEDYLEEEKRYLAGKRYQKDRDYFAGQRNLCNEVVYLSDRSTEDHESQRYTASLGSDIREQMRCYAEKYQCSMYAMFMTVFALYISRVKMNREKLFIGTPILNRIGRKEKYTAGMFVNTVPLFAGLSYGKTFSENMIEMEKRILAVMRHQKVNYDDLLSYFREKGKTDEKLYDVILSFQNAIVAIPGGKSDWYSCGMQEESLQIHIDDRNDEGIWNIHYDYQIAKFAKDEIAALHSCVMNLLRDVLSHEQKKIAELEMISDEEKKRLFLMGRPQKTDNEQIDVLELLKRQVRKTPDKPAVITKKESLTYDELDRYSNRIAHALIKRGIGRGDIVAIILPRIIYFPAFMYGILKTGAAYMPIDPTYPEERIRSLTRSEKVVLQITEHNYKDFLNEEDECEVEHVISGEDLFCALHTSGSTGTPKLSLLKHRGIAHFILTHDDFYRDVQIAISATIITFDAFMLDSVVAITKGITMYLADHEEIFDQAQFEQMFYDYDQVVFFATPTKMRSYIENSSTKEFMKKIHSIVAGGEVFTKELYEMIRKYAPQSHIFNIYGPTETTICVTVDELDGEDVTIGRPTPGNEIYLLDRYGMLVPRGQCGEIWIGGDGVGAGYLDQKLLTEERFIDNLYGEGKLYKTGDLAYWRTDGKLVFQGRNDLQVKIRGLRIELEEIENVINSCAGILQSAVNVQKNEKNQQYICAFYTADRNISADEIREAIRKKLPRYMVPHIFEQLSSMKHTPSGKVDRKELPKLNLSNIRSQVEFVKPQTELQRELAQIMEIVLDHRPIGLKDDFFDLGGDSLKAIECVSKAHSRGIYFPTQAIFDHPEVEELCRYIESGDEHKISLTSDDFIDVQSLIEHNQISNEYQVSVSEVGNLFLTGATGYLGIHILAEFLREETGYVYCLVRGKSEEESRSRFAELLNFYFGEKYYQEMKHRIIVLRGDLGWKKFGLSEDVYQKVAMDVHTVIHAAASVKHYGSYRYFQETNVEATKRVIEFTKTADANLLHMSTLSVSGNSLGDNFDNHRSEEEKFFYERSFFIGQSMDNVYVRSKFEAEWAVLKAMKEGVRVNICRMGNLTNRYLDGRFQYNYDSNAFLKRVKAFLNLGYFPDYLMHLYVEFSPVDESARAVMKIARYFNSTYNVFHINNNKVLYFAPLFEILEKKGYPIRVVDGGFFAEILRRAAEKNGTEYLFETFINDMDGQEHLNYDSNIRIMNDYTVDYLKKIGFEWNEIGEEYMGKYLDYFQKIGYWGAL